ncbi:hypothetical protein [Nocardiopsis sp. TNDT3]|uniref:hypothetical protein n=1 Tax=Nocardiopsis sp. TNDT3 TaxID=2249354 RepID=UPI0013001DD1|nr:hypothetical protein [Nocardiopsis sp. TNDT3]
MSNCACCHTKIQGSGYKRDGVTYCGAECHNQDVFDVVAKLMTANPDLLKDAADSDD